MKQIFLILAISVLFFACSKNEEPIIIPSYGDVTVTNSKTEKLVNYLNTYGNIIADKHAPFLISADEVYSNFRNPLYHVIDIRNADAFDYGHIPGAKNIEIKNVLDYLAKEINPYSYDKIVIACYSGQQSSYYTGLLRILGYNNVYSLKWGMTSWNKDFAQDFWMKKTSNKFAQFFVKEGLEKTEKYNLPEINVESENTSIILENRISQLFAEDDAFKAKAEDVFANLNSYYIFSFWPQTRYEADHIQGSFNFEPLHELTSIESLKYLPTDKPIVVYCNTGQYSAFVAAYLRTLGYNAKSMLFGANGMIYNKMKEYGWSVFNADEHVNNFEYAEGDNDKDFFTETAIATQSSNNSSSPAMPVKSGAKKKKAAEGGCS